MSNNFKDKINSRHKFHNWLARQNVQELAERLGCDRQLIYFWLSGKCYPSTKYASRILDEKVAGKILKLSDIAPPQDRN